MQDWKNVVGVLSDDALLAETRACASNERERTAWLVAHLAEVYRRDLALKRGFPSLKDYARQELGLSERQAWDRIHAARLALQMPEVIEQLASGKLTLCAASVLWSTLKQAESPVEPPSPLPLAIPMPAPVPVTKPSLEEKRELLGQVLGKSGQESKALLQNWQYERRGTDPATRPRPPSRRQPDGIWTELSLFQSDAELTDWDQLRDLLSHKLGTRDPHAVFEWLKQLGLKTLDPARREARVAAKRVKQQDAAMRKQRACASQQQERKRERDYTASDLRKLKIQHQNRCQFTDRRTGRKCESTAYIDIDHKIPLCDGGKDVLANLTLACASHNRRRPRWSQADQPTYARPQLDLTSESPPPLRRRPKLPPPSCLQERRRPTEFATQATPCRSSPAVTTVRPGENHGDQGIRRSGAASARARTRRHPLRSRRSSASQRRSRGRRGHRRLPRRHGASRSLLHRSPRGVA